MLILKNNIKINSLIDVKVKEINKFKNKIFNLNTELNSILNKRDSLNKQLLFIERNYIPKIYFKTYFKKRTETKMNRNFAIGLYQASDLFR